MVSMRNHRLSKLALALSLALGCGSTSPPPPARSDGGADAGATAPPPASIADGTHSGSRLRVVYAQGFADGQPDGSQFPYALRDDKLGALCSPGYAVDARRRCIPDGATLSGYFADATCQQSLYTTPKCTELAAFAVNRTLCGARIFRAAPYELNNFIYRTNLLRCEQVVPSADLKELSWYVAGAEVPAADLAEVVYAAGAPR